MKFLAVLSVMKEITPILLILVLIWLGFQLKQIGSELDELREEIMKIRHGLREWAASWRELPIDNLDREILSNEYRIGKEK